MKQYRVNLSYVVSEDTVKKFMQDNSVEDPEMGAILLMANWIDTCVEARDYDVSEEEVKCKDENDYSANAKAMQDDGVPPLRCLECNDTQTMSLADKNDAVWELACPYCVGYLSGQSLQLKQTIQIAALADLVIDEGGYEFEEVE